MSKFIWIIFPLTVLFLEFFIPKNNKIARNSRNIYHQVVLARWRVIGHSGKERIKALK